MHRSIYLIYILLVAGLVYITVMPVVQVGDKHHQSGIGSYLVDGEELTEEHIVGKARMNPNITEKDEYNTSVGTLIFDPKARTNWHSHRTGEILVVVEGKGYYQEKGKPPILVQKGDIVRIPKNVEHWYGASTDQKIRYIDIVPNLNNDKLGWQKPVSAKEYELASKNLKE